LGLWPGYECGDADLIADEGMCKISFLKKSRRESQAMSLFPSNEMISKSPRIGFVGFGEVAYHFSKGLKEDGIREILAYDKNASEIKKGKMGRRGFEGGRPMRFLREGRTILL
jgi:hypothetical protein